MVRLKTKLSNLKPDTFFVYDDNDEAILCQLSRVSNGTFHLFAVSENKVETLTDDKDTTVYLVNEVPAEILKNLGRNKAVHSIEKKMNYIIGRVQFGPLTSMEEAELLELLEGRASDKNIWTMGIKTFFDKKNAGDEVDQEAFFDGMASQCMDDIMTMTCILGMNTVIFLLRTVNK